MSEQPTATPQASTVDTLRAALPASLNTSTLYALATLVDWKSATLDTLHPATRPALESGAVQAVWIVETDSFEIGNSDLDNIHSMVGVYASLEIAVADVWRKIVAGDRIFNPVFGEHVVATVLVPTPDNSAAAVPYGWASTDDSADDSAVAPHGLSTGWDA